jgi:hypothetical protein
MTDHRTAALAVALHNRQHHTHPSPCASCEIDAAAILAALPADWCGHDRVIEAYKRAIRDLGSSPDAQANIAVQLLQAEIARLRSILALHNKTPTGRTRKCLPGCIACAALEEKP